MGLRNDNRTDALREAIAFGLAVRRAVHRQPELSGQEWATARFLQKELTALGYSISTIDTGPSFLAFDPACRRFPLGLRAELDALPIEELSTNEGPKSEYAGVMHACGHDMHMGIACAFAHHQAKTRSARGHDAGTLFVFESSEEVLPGGARAVLASDAFAARKPDSMFAFHCDPAWPVGTLAGRAGEYMASGDELHFAVRGHGGHGALPHEHDDPLLAAAHLVVALQSMMGRTLPAAVPGVLSIGRFEALGATNIVPDTASLEGTLRMHNETWRATVKARIRNVAEGIGKAFNVNVETNIIEGYPTLINSAALLAKAQDAAARLGGQMRFEGVGLRMTTDDFSRFAQAIPSLYLRLGVGPNCGNLHTSTFCPNEEALGVGVEWLTAYHELLTAGDFRQSTRSDAPEDMPGE